MNALDAILRLAPIHARAALGGAAGGDRVDRLAVLDRQARGTKPRCVRAEYILYQFVI